MCRRATLFLLSSLFVFSSAAKADHMLDIFPREFEIGGAGGFSIYRSASVTSPVGTASIGFESEPAGGVVIGENLYRFIGGEFRYMYCDGDLNVKEGGLKGTLEGHSHAIHYDFLFHATNREARVRPFAAVGGGIKVYEGSGPESPTQPLSRFVLLTKTDEVEGMLSVGGGVKFMVAKNVQLRVDFRDYITPTPDRLFAPLRGGAIKGWMHDFVPMFGVSYVFK
jgi:hypothetical protein